MSPFGACAEMVICVAPQRIPQLTGIVSVSSGCRYILCVDENGSAFMFGGNIFGECGNVSGVLCLALAEMFIRSAETSTAAANKRAADCRR